MSNVPDDVKCEAIRLVMEVVLDDLYESKDDLRLDAVWVERTIEAILEARDRPAAFVLRDELRKRRQARSR